MIFLHFLFFKFYSNKEAKHKILVKSNNAGRETLSIDNVITVEKDQVQEALTSCLEEPLQFLLDNWWEGIKRMHQTKQTQHVISEIESIRKQMLFEDTKEVIESDDPNSTSKNIVPGTIKEYLYRLVLSPRSKLIYLLHNK